MNNNYERLLNEVVKNFKSKKYKGIYDDILSDIDQLEESYNLYGLKKKSHSSLMYEVRMIKADFTEELKEIIAYYHSVIFKDFSFKNDLNILVTGARTLKIWLVRYMCMDALDVELSEIINEDVSSLNVTQQYLEIDNVLFNKVLNIKVVNK